MYKWEYLCIVSESYMNIEILQALRRYRYELADTFCSVFPIFPKGPERFLGPRSSSYKAKHLQEENKE